MRAGRVLGLLLSLTFASNAAAGVTVLGFETGASTVDQVKATLKKTTTVQNSGVNEYSKGPMLQTDGSSYGIDGLLTVTYIFDAQNKLAAVLMHMSKDRFNDVFNTLSSKYQLADQQRPFVGNQFARFTAGDVTIEEDAPHMSFEMDVRYVRNDLLARFKSQSAEDTKQKEDSERSKF